MDDSAAESRSIALGMPIRIGSYQGELPFAKDLLDFWLTRFPRLYLFVEEHREWKNWDKRVYLSLIKRGDTVMDIGANVGAHTVAFSHLVGREGRVISFEPVAANYERLRENVSRRTRYPNTTVFPIAIGNPKDSGEGVFLKVPGDDFTQASLVEHSAGSWRGNSGVREYATTLASIDAEAPGFHLDRLDFVKIDVEGGELNAIKGAASTIQRFLPLLYCELYEKWAASFGYTPSGIFSFASSLGYTQARVIRGGKVHATSLDDPVPTRLFDSSADVLFVAPTNLARVAGFDNRYCDEDVIPRDRR